MEIKHKYTGAVLFTVEGNTLSRANLSRANLSGADLSRADLSRANLSGADLSRADLSGANLSGANLYEVQSLWGTSGNLREVKALQCETYPVTYTATHMQIGCQLHTLEQWWAFSDPQIARMDSSAAQWWAKWKPILKAVVEASPAV